MVWGSSKRLIDDNNVSDSLIKACFWSAKCSPIDLVIRSSEETWLSDFLLWRTGYTTLVFDDTLWPDFSGRNLFNAIFIYQKFFKSIEMIKTYDEKQREFNEKERNKSDRSQKDSKTRINTFLQNLEAKRAQNLKLILETELLYWQ